MSFKNNAKKSIAAISAAALAISFLTGCTDDETPSDIPSSVESVSGSSSAAPENSDTVSDTVSEAVSDVSSEPETSSVVEENSSVVSETTVSSVNLNESQVPAQHEPIVISSSTTTTTPVPKPTNPDDTRGYIGGEPVSSSKPASSSKPVQSSSRPVSSSTPPSSSTPTQLTPDDTTGFVLDTNGRPADGLAWMQKKGTTRFVDSNGQLWIYKAGLGWSKPSSGGMIDDGSGIELSGNKIGH